MCSIAVPTYTASCCTNKTAKYLYNPNKIIATVDFAASPQHPHNNACSIWASTPLFCQVGLPDAGAGGARHLCLDLSLSEQRVQSISCDTPKEMGHSCLSRGQLFSIQIPDVVQSVLHSLSWLLAIDHKQGTWVLNKRRGFMLWGSKHLTDSTKIHH